MSYFFSNPALLPPALTLLTTQPDGSVVLSSLERNTDAGHAISFPPTLASVIRVGTTALARLTRRVNGCNGLGPSTGAHYAGELHDQILGDLAMAVL